MMDFLSLISFAILGYIASVALWINYKNKDASALDFTLLYAIVFISLFTIGIEIDWILSDGYEVDLNIDALWIFRDVMMSVVMIVLIKLK